jgi:hypothetical protein
MAEERVQSRSATILAAHIVAKSRPYESGEPRTRIDFTHDIARRFEQGSYKAFTELPIAPGHPDGNPTARSSMGPSLDIRKLGELLCFTVMEFELGCSLPS